MDHDELRAVLGRRMQAHHDDLDALVRIPSVSAAGFDASTVRRSAEYVRELLARTGLEHTQLLEIDGSHPAVYGDWLHAQGAPTVLLYAHHDVQPPGDPAVWTSPAFEPAERGGRLYGRGAADDKAGVIAHVAAIDTWLQARGGLPLNVRVFIEGEEEIGSEHLGQFLTSYFDLLDADAVIVTDTDNWKVGVPGITYLLRGLVDCVVEVRALDHALHSGMYGGVVPDPVMGLAKLLAALTDSRGEIAIPGFADDAHVPGDAERRAIDALDYDEKQLRADAGLLDGVAVAGDGGRSILERMWLRPSVTIIGFDATPVATASNTIAPSARARVSVRLAPGQDPPRAMDLLTSWLAENVGWGLQATITEGGSGAPFLADPSSVATRDVFTAAERALTAAFGVAPVYQGVGGSIPFVPEMTAALGGDGDPVPALLLGVEDPDTRAHGIDESLHLADFTKACLGEAFLLGELAQAMAR